MVSMFFVGSVVETPTSCAIVEGYEERKGQWSTVR